MPLLTPIVLLLSLRNVDCSVIDERESGAPGGRLVKGESASDERVVRRWRSRGPPVCRRDTRVLRGACAMNCVRFYVTRGELWTPGSRRRSDLF